MVKDEAIEKFINYNILDKSMKIGCKKGDCKW